MSDLEQAARRALGTLERTAIRLSQGDLQPVAEPVVNERNINQGEQK